ncbi:tetratricopeptide repeat protein [Desulfoluna butyratoxydans]|uniref:Tetratricopeptide-like helical domain n=1 Tax=Desulfoluna butyratoxydans TaxID=231438 RepID=A0A4U8YPM8_9BACT|nr:tetratricopeptide repeat protein [Desulfoluna butyratoxydans]VFQ45397.1 tetratricopeptide-like helical domain [Desulfoluna butyratoxydans]
MRVKLGHYVYFWAVNSLMAAGTGLVLGIFAIRVGISLISPMSFPICFVVIYQFYIVSYFWGKRRGEFEFSFLERSAIRGEENQELKIRLKKVRQELKWGDPASAHAKLTAALKDFPDNFVACFKYAVSCERMGMGDDAIASYNKAETLIPTPSTSLRCYVAKQSTRVKKEGPSRRSSSPGLQYVIY